MLQAKIAQRNKQIKFLKDRIKELEREVESLTESYREYVKPEKFDYWETLAREIGFSWVMSSPFTRSSYHAETKFS